MLSNASRYYLVERHLVQFDCPAIIATCEADVGDVHPQLSGLGEHLVLDDDVVHVQRFAVHLVVGVL